MRTEENLSANCAGSESPAGSDPSTLLDVERALSVIAAGGVVIVVDDEGRENEGDLIMSAHGATQQSMAFFMAHTSGVICVGLAPEICDRLSLTPMVPPSESTDARGTAFTVSVDARLGIATGISAADRALTACVLADPSAQAGDLTRPGHVFPLRARPGGVLERRGHTEAGVDLCRLAGLAPAALLCEIVNRDGTMARGAQLQDLADQHELPIISVEQIVAYRVRNEPLVTREVECLLPTDLGQFEAKFYRSLPDGSEHLALVCGDPAGSAAPLVRIHSECFTGDIFGSQRCDCGDQLASAMTAIAAAGCGIVLYMLGHEGRGIGLINKLKAYALQDTGLDTVDANVALGLPVDDRDYTAAAGMLRDLGVSRVRLLTNNPSKSQAMVELGIEVDDVVELPPVVTAANLRYLRTKRERMGHTYVALDAAGHVP